MNAPARTPVPSPASRLGQAFKALLERLWTPLFYWMLLIALWGVMFDIRIPA